MRHRAHCAGGDGADARHRVVLLPQLLSAVFNTRLVCQRDLACADGSGHSVVPLIEAVCVFRLPVEMMHLAGCAGGGGADKRHGVFLLRQLPRRWRPTFEQRHDHILHARRQPGCSMWQGQWLLSMRISRALSALRPRPPLEQRHRHVFCARNQPGCRKSRGTSSAEH